MNASTNPVPVGTPAVTTPSTAANQLVGAPTAPGQMTAHVAVSTSQPGPFASDHLNGPDWALIIVALVLIAVVQTWANIRGRRKRLAAEADQAQAAADAQAQAEAEWNTWLAENTDETEPFSQAKLYAGHYDRYIRADLDRMATQSGRADHDLYHGEQ